MNKFKLSYIDIRVRINIEKYDLNELINVIFSRFIPENIK
jgi:hypothetical protein